MSTSMNNTSNVDGMLSERTIDIEEYYKILKEKMVSTT
jgi:hypothetical protein